jgi:gamma-glutamyltranspeptidase/glutathione hydrolase
MSFRYAPGRPAAYARQVMVATSQPAATRAGLRMLERGGNAVDAAIAAAAVLTVTEPMATGVGGDCFAIVRDGDQTIGLDAAGPAPASADPVSPVDQHGPRAVTVPGAVAGWAALSARFGRVGFDACLADAIDVAGSGFAVGTRVSASWARVDPPSPLPAKPPPGMIIRQPEAAATLRSIAEHGPDWVYGGAVADAIAEVSWLTQQDLSGYRPRWVQPLSLRYGDVDVYELPAPTQGVAALEGLGILARTGTGIRDQVNAMQLALEDALASVRDEADVSGLIEPGFLDRRAREIPRVRCGPHGGTVYLCVVDGDRQAVSFIQSVYDNFGSGIKVPGTGMILQNRGACFSISGQVEPGRRSYHTLMPGMLRSADNDLAGPFGIMGGFVQPQAHLQFVSNLVDGGCDPQAALDHPRFRIDGGSLRLEQGLWDYERELASCGLQIIRDTDTFGFGGGQAIISSGEALVGGSDSRKDGYAAGY